MLDAIRPRVIVVADSELPATARASARLKERLLRRKILVLHTRETGAVTISLRPSSCTIQTANHQRFNLTDLPEMVSAPTAPPPEFPEEESER